MRVILAIMAMLTLAQPAYACAMDGFFGAHRFNPFLNMGVGSTDQSAEQEYDSSDTQDDYADVSDDQEYDGSDQSTLEYEPSDL